MINKETFCSKVEEKVRELNPEAVVTIGDVNKVNCVKTAISCRIGEENSVAKSIYFEDYEGKDEELDVLVSRAAQLLLGDDGEGAFYADKFMTIQEDKELFMAHVRVCLLNEQNAELAYCEKSKRFDGLVESYYINFDKCCVWITEKMLDYLSIEKEELRAAAFKNSSATTRISGMMDVLADLTETVDVPDEIKERCEELRKDPTNMYVVSNKERFRGAICAENVEKLAEYLGDDLYILPSSIHEMIAVPKHMGDVTAERLLSMVVEVNATQVEADERLIDAVYEYSREDKNFKKVA